MKSVLKLYTEAFVKQFYIGFIMSTLAIPSAFVWRRLHSLMGLWLVLFLCEHLLTNSQAALWLGDNGKGFVSLVNGLHNLPYLEVIEVTLLGIPFLIHAVWGVKYLMTAKSNVAKTDGSTPSISLPRNRAYSWQRITSWILLFFIIFHVTKFRFLQYPEKVTLGKETLYLVDLTFDKGLYTLAERLNVSLYDVSGVSEERAKLQDFETAALPPTENYALLTGPLSTPYSKSEGCPLIQAQSHQEQLQWVKALEKENVSPGHVIAAARDFGTAELLVVRDTFKKPIYMVLYTLFVLAACFHASNGFWTFLITWGWVLKMAAQRAWVTVSCVLMAVLIFLGLSAIYGTYWFNLRY